MNKSDLYDHYIAGGLTPEEATLAVENADGGTEIVEGDAHATLISSFVFRESKQGHNFWYEIVERILSK